MVMCRVRSMVLIIRMVSAMGMVVVMTIVVDMVVVIVMSVVFDVCAYVFFIYVSRCVVMYVGLFGVRSHVGGRCMCACVLRVCLAYM